MKRQFLKLISSLFFGAILVSCAHSPSPEEGPWGLIKNPDAREKYMMVQAAAGSLTYKKLYQNIKMLNEMYPDEDVISITHAGIYGDYGQSQAPEVEKEYKTKAIEMLKPFVTKSYKSEISQDRILAYNQYYYHSAQFQKQYEYGKKVIALGGHGGEVLVAVGGSMHALELDQNNDILNARVLALEARQTWESLYDMSIPQMREAAYQNSFYISSLAITGECSQAQEIFDSKLKETKRYAEMERWYQKFNPKNIQNCQNGRQLTSQ